MSAFERVGPHLKGWQLAVAAVGTALLGVALALPRPVPPKELPLPAVDRPEELAAAVRDQERVRSARATPLPFLVRAAGEAFRRFGTAEAKGDEPEADAQQNAFARRVEAARTQHGDGMALALRAVQTELFVAAVRRRDTPELRELGGKFFADQGSDVATSMSSLADDELGSLFSMRWLKLAGLVGKRPFSPTLNEWRLYYRTLLSHAELASPRLKEDPVARALSLARCIEALAKLDPDYPAVLGLGVTQHWMGHYEQAENLFATYITAHPAGAMRLRVQNYLLAARQRIPAVEQ